MPDAFGEDDMAELQQVQRVREQIDAMRRQAGARRTMAARTRLPSMQVSPAR